MVFKEMYIGACSQNLNKILLACLLLDSLATQTSLEKNVAIWQHMVFKICSPLMPDLFFYGLHLLKACVSPCQSCSPYPSQQGSKKAMHA